MFAVTHDDQWIALLEKGILRPEELTQGRLEEVVSQEYHIVTRDGAVYLQNIEPEASGSIASGQSPSALFAANSVTSSQTKSDVDMDDDNNDNHEEEEQVKQDDRPLTTTANASSEEYKTTDGEDSDRTIEEMDIEDSACEAEETVPSRSYSNFNRTEARLASQLVKPGPVIFPPSHSYRLSRSSANIPGLYQHPRHAPPLQWSIGAYAPPRLSATKSAAQQNAINGSKLPSSSAVEHWHESQKNVDRPEDQEIGDDSSNENELKSHRSLECGTSPHLIHPDAMEVGPSTTTSIPPGAPYIQPPSFIGFDSEPLADSDSTGSALPDVDPRIVEALKGKDRVYILKLGEQMESLINDRRLARKTDATTKVVRVLLTPDSRIPSRRFAELAPAQSPAQLTSKILLQSPTDRQISKPHSRTGSVAGEDSDLSDQEPPGATSLGWHSNATWRRKNLETLSSPRLITHSTRQARAYHHASDLPAEFWRALSQNEAASNVILPFAKKALNFPREDDNGDQLWIVLYDGTNDVEFVLSCTKGPLGNYPIFIVTSKSSSQIAQEEKHGKKLADSLLPLVLCLLNEVPPQRVFSVFSIAKVAWTFAEIFEVNTRHEHGIEALEQPYYDATLTFCTSETLNEPPDSMASFPASGSDDIVVDRRRADMSHLKGITAMCKAFSETSPPFVLDDLGAELEARLLITNQQACVHVVHKDGQEPEIACLVATTRESENVTAITKVFTAEHWKGRGFAARLLHCVCQCILQKKKRVVLYVDNSEASVSIRKVYHKIGFQGLDVSGQQVKDVERWMEIGFVGTNLGHW
ncbi:hypothetical protein OG21DRAFT_746191 [Imleria badia]|nr:hypothetical protein OG21DRAFT_746191 [Imleria badia]